MEKAGYELILERMEKACSLPFASHSLADVIAALKAGHMQAFWNDEAVVVTEICTTPRRRFLNIHLVAGSLDSVLALQTQVASFARKQGLTEVQATCRPGWFRRLKKRGWEKCAEVLTLPLEHWGNG